MKKKFIKADLKNGDVVLRRNRGVEIVIVEIDTMICKHGGYNELKEINENLTDVCGDSCDIMQVRRPKKSSDCCFDAFRFGYGELVYDRTRDDLQVEEMTFDEVCQALGKNIKIVSDKK